jgi:hypothetical protein
MELVAVVEVFQVTLIFNLLVMLVAQGVAELVDLQRLAVLEHQVKEIQEEPVLLALKALVEVVLVLLVAAEVQVTAVLVGLVYLFL